MTEIETQDILTSTLESVKTQMVYLRALNDAFNALFDAVARVYPELDSIHKEEIRKIRPNPVQDEHIRSLDAPLEKLEKSRRDLQMQEQAPHPLQ